MLIRYEQIKNPPPPGSPVTLRVTTTPFTLTNNEEIIFVNPDVPGTDMVLNLPPGTTGKHFRIIHTGNQKKRIQIFASPGEKIFDDDKEKLKRGEAIDIHFHSIEGWW